MNLGTHTVLIARSCTPRTNMLLFQCASTTVTVAAFEAIDKTVMYSTKATFTNDTALEIPTLLTVDFIADGGSAVFDQTGTSCLVAEDKLALIALANVLLDTVHAELTFTDGTVSLSLAYGT